MNKEHIDNDFIDAINLWAEKFMNEHNEEVKTSKEYDEQRNEILKVQYKSIIELQNREKNLIKYLEDNIKIQKSRYEWYLNDFQKNKNEVVRGILKETQLMIHIYQDILERIKSGKYE